jgi:putative endonuclease
MFYIYILKSESIGKYYIGSTINIPQRVAYHNAGMVLSTKSYRPWKLIYSEEFSTLSQARHREHVIKSWKNPAYMVKTLRLFV